MCEKYSQNVLRIFTLQKDKVTLNDIPLEIKYTKWNEIYIDV